MEPNKLKDRLKGVLVVMTTPFTKNNEIDEDGLRKHTEFLVEKGAGKPLALVSTGSTGEFYALSDEEQKRVIRISR